MQRPRLWILFSLLIDLLLLVACVYHIPYMAGRGQLPFLVRSEQNTHTIRTIIAPEACPEVRPGDRLLEPLNAIPNSLHLFEFHLDFLRSGERVPITIQRDQTRLAVSVTLIPFYSGYEIAVYLLIAALTLSVAAFLLLASPPSGAVIALHWAMAFMATTVGITWGHIQPHESWTYISRGLFFLSYSGLFCCFVLFTALFPTPKPGSLPLKVAGTATPMAAITALLMYFHFRDITSGALAYSEQFVQADATFHVLSAIYLAVGLANIMHSYVTSFRAAERKQLQWILWGLAVGSLPFIALTSIGEFLFPEARVPEAFTIPFLLLIPLSFATAVIKYHLFDISVVISRTASYSIVLAAVVAAYIGVVGLVAGIVEQRSASVIAAVLICLGFEPLRRVVQRSVDKIFFRVQYDFRTAVRKLEEEIKLCVDANQLGELLIRQLQNFIPVERIALFRVRRPEERIMLLAHAGFDLLAERSVRLQSEHLKTNLTRPVCMESAIEPGLDVEHADERVFARWGMALAVALKASGTIEGGGNAGDVIGFLVLGNKKSGERFSAEDIDLLTSVAGFAALELERIALQQSLLAVHAEKERLAELNTLKSDFVSYVSHELKTPITSILMFSELLKKRIGLRDRKSSDFLMTVEQEAKRLNRMITTILDSARIEEGTKEYNCRPSDLGTITKEVMNVMAYQLSMNNFTVRFSPPKRPLPILADRDAVAQALINLISNAIKYSGERKSLHIVLRKGNGMLSCAVHDRGRGIPAESLPHIFQKFYREPGLRRSVEGVGLGLPLVRHIMNAHNGTISVVSEPGKGSTFTLSFPAYQKANGKAQNHIDR